LESQGVSTTWPDLAAVILLARVEEDPDSLALVLKTTPRIAQGSWLENIHSVLSALRDSNAIEAFRGLDTKSLPPLRPWGQGPRPRPASLAEVDSVLREFGDTRVLTYTQPTDSDPYLRVVGLVVRSDGSLAVVKEVWDEGEGPLGPHELETRLVEDLESKGALPKGTFLGSYASNGHTYLWRAFQYGKILADTEWRGVPEHQAIPLVRSLASSLAALHSHGVVYLDLRPENVLTDGSLFDFGHSRRLPEEGSFLRTCLLDPEYAAPEVTCKRVATTATDIFSLGVLFHTLLTGKHPFHPLDGADARVTYAVPNAVSTYRGEGIQNPRVKDLLGRMLAKDPGKRPSAREVALALERWAGGDPNSWLRLPKRSRQTSPRVLVPMRAGVPHKGHVNLLCRLLDLGFLVQVSLQMAYTWTDQDPLPKWVVSKMLRAAVVERGYSDEDVQVLLTPFEALQNLHLHFLLMPWWEAITMVVSGNPTVHDLLGPIAEERALVRSEVLCGDLTDANGTRLRAALLRKEVRTVKEMLPPVIGTLWPDLLEQFPRPGEFQVEFPVKVTVDVQDENGGVLYEGISLRRYEGPEEAVLRRLRRDYESLAVTCDLTPETKVRGADKDHSLTYLGQCYNLAQKTLKITYRWV
jgi:hypothetical protein